MISKIFRPKHILNPISHSGIEVKTAKLDKTNYIIVTANNATLFTNCKNNITLMKDNSIEPLTSWHCRGWDSLPPNENELLTGKLLITKYPKHFSGDVASLLCGQVGHYNYFHWFYDVLVRIKLIESAHGDLSVFRFFVPELSLAFQKESIELIGIKTSQLISSIEFPFIKADRIITTTHPIHTSWNPPGWTIDFVRSRFLPSASDLDLGPLIYISRGDSNNSRMLTNEAELTRKLESQGFVAVKLSKYSLVDQIAIFSRARMIVAVHGAGLTNLSFVSPGTIVYELCCIEYPNTTFEAISSHLGIDHHYVRCDVANYGIHPMTHDLFIPEEKIEIILKHLEGLID
jgi:capsular polysaccharide biosynthesis protein